MSRDGWDPDDLPDSQQQLLDDLRERDAPEWMKKKLLAGYYHDYASPVAMPKSLLVIDLEGAEIVDLIPDVKQGAYDP